MRGGPPGRGGMRGGARGMWTCVAGVPNWQAGAAELWAAVALRGAAAVAAVVRAEAVAEPVAVVAVRRAARTSW